MNAIQKIEITQKVLLEMKEGCETTDEDIKAIDHVLSMLSVI